MVWWSRFRTLCKSSNESLPAQSGRKNQANRKLSKIQERDHQTCYFIDVLSFVIFRRLDRVMEWATAQSSDKWNSMRFHMSLDCTGSDSVALWKRRKWKITETLKNKWSGDNFLIILMKSRWVYEIHSLVITFSCLWEKLRESHNGFPNIVIF